MNRYAPGTGVIQQKRSEIVREEQLFQTSKEEYGFRKEGKYSTHLSIRENRGWYWHLIVLLKSKATGCQGFIGPNPSTFLDKYVRKNELDCKSNKPAENTVFLNEILRAIREWDGNYWSWIKYLDKFRKLFAYMAQ